MSETTYPGHELEALADLDRYNRRIVDAFGPGLRGRVLEVGAGIGNFSARFVDVVDEAVLLEPSAVLAPRLVERFRDRADVLTLEGTLEAQSAPGGSAALAPGSFDAVVCVNVLEHVADDVHLLERMRAVLRPGGALLLYVPALGWLFGSLDAELCHLRRYALRELRRKVAGAGFEVVELRYFDLLGAFGWWLAGRVLRRRTFDGFSARLYDRVAVPMTTAIERVGAPFGKNLLCVARRRESRDA